MSKLDKTIVSTIFKALLQIARKRQQQDRNRQFIGGKFKVIKHMF